MIPSDPITLVLSIILCLFLVRFFYGWKKNAYNLPPGPRPLPIIGNLHILDMKRPYLTMHELSKKYGPVYTLQLGVEKVIVICGYEAVKDALVNHADEFSGRPKVVLIDELAKGHGILFASLDNWRTMRRFTLSTLRDFGMGTEAIENKISEESDNLVQKFRSYKGEPFDNNMNITAAVSNIIVSILLSKRFDYEDPTLLKLIKMISENNQLGGTLIMLYNTYPSVMRWFPNVAEKALRNANEVCAFIRETFKINREQLDVNDQRNLIDSFLVKQREEKPNPKLYFTNENLTQLVADLFDAGMDTTSTTLRWGLLLMMKYPEIQRKETLKDDGNRFIKKSVSWLVSVSVRCPCLAAVHVWPVSVSGRSPCLVVVHVWPLSMSGRCPCLAAVHVWSLSALIKILRDRNASLSVSRCAAGEHVSAVFTLAQ
ncbi:cytochrome P450 2K6-like isoform X2 [Ranitomeya imitator]|uniref:cytochrome P450 2K6-like isoform X2 n=1 Tax=Ranitomeya imitator TaxID=111125 RepID=UPI0037E8D743